MRCGLLAALVAVLGLLPVLPASALQILPTQDDRIVSVTLAFGGTLQEVPGPGFPDFNESVNFVGVGSANQLSSIGATEMTGAGDDFTDGAGDTSGFSIFDVRFQVDEVVSYLLSGSVYGYGYSPATDVLPTVNLSGPGGVLFEPGLPSGVGPYPFEGTGTLLPGVEYRLLVASAHQGGVDENGTGGEGHEWSFSFAIAVPEPATGALVPLAVALAAGLGRRRA